MAISETIRKRLIKAKAPYQANVSIAEHIKPGELAKLQAEVATKFQAVLDALIIEADHNTAGTAKRVAKMYLQEVFAGRYHPRPELTDFPNVRKLDELYSVGPCAIRSACSHHFCPIEGHVWCGVIPSERIIGLSKFSRLARWVTSRPQIQEEAIVQMANELEAVIKPRGLAVVMKARHTCMTWRGVNEHETTMTTSVVRGILKESAAARSEFYAMITAQGFSR